MRTHIFAVMLVAGCAPSTSFDQTKWRTANINGRARAEMLPDFLTKHELIGMPRQRVIALLGPPTTTDKERRTDMIYILGNDGSMFAIDDEWLTIKLDKHDRVASFERWTD